MFGRNWLEQIQLDWKAIRWASAESHEDVKPLIDKYNNVFSNELGAITGFEAHLEVKPHVTPVFCKARPILFSLKPQVDQELDRLVDVGILKKVSYSEWASPIVPVPKKDGQLRICVDYKVSINPCLVVDKYPLPSPEDLFSTLTGGQHFTKLDLSRAYQQMVLAEIHHY